MQRRERARMRWVAATRVAALVMPAVVAFVAGWIPGQAAPVSAGASIADRNAATLGTSGAAIRCGVGGTRQSPGAGTTVGVVLLRVGGGDVAVAKACIGRHGPYTFVIGTGSPRSAIDTRLAASLHVRPRGTVALGGSGCATNGRLVAVPALRIGPIAVAPQTMVRASLGAWSGQHVDGVLGSDVWGRYGALRLDLVHRTLTVAGPEGPAPAVHSFAAGKAGIPPPPSVGLAAPARSAPVAVVEAPGSIAPFVQVAVAGNGPYAFALDTGSPTSSLSATVGFTLRLPDQGTAAAPGGIGCAGSVPTLVPTPVVIGAPGGAVAGGSWARTLTFRATVLPGPSAPGPARSAMVGSLGLDVLGADGALVVDYTNGTLTTGS